MKKSAIVLAVAAAASLITGVAQAADDAGTAHMKMNDAANASSEKCMVVKDGKGLIKAGKSDCKATSHSCAGNNKAGDPESWIYVPKGQCDKVKAGDMSGLSDELKAKIESANAAESGAAGDATTAPAQ